MHDKTDVGRLTPTTFFSGARSKCFPYKCFSFSGTFKRGETHGRDVELVASFEKPLSKVRRSRELESVHLSQTMTEKPS